VARSPNRLSRPEFTKTPFGGVPATAGVKAKKLDTNELLPGRKALDRLSKKGVGIMEFNRLDPIGSGALNQGFINTKLKSF
jgi:hypothetical protein